MQELAGGVTPLKQLARNVPHGFKGDKLLETLAAKQVPFLRATWYIKIVGLSEMVIKQHIINCDHSHYIYRVNAMQAMLHLQRYLNLFNGHISSLDI